MTTIWTPTAAALRPRTSSTQMPPFVLPLDHNSIVSSPRVITVATVNAALVRNGQAGYGAAKQAAPPRGVPR